MLVEQRTQIDVIDQKLVQLLEARLKIVEEVAIIKQENRLPVFDEAREKNLLAELALKVENSAYTESIEEVFKCLLKVSKEYQVTIITKGKSL